MSDTIEVRVFFAGGSGGPRSDGAIEGSHLRRFPVVPTVGQTLVFGKPNGEIAVYRVAETGFFLWDEGTSLWIMVAPVTGAQRAPAGFYDPLAKAF